MKVIVCKGCQHKMNGIDEKGKLACPICCGISSDSGIPIEMDVPDKATCWYCGTETTNNGNLPFYDAKHNKYYCGCRGWD